MKKNAHIPAAFFGLDLLAALTVSCSKGPAIEEPTHGESILDRVVRIEPARRCTGLSPSEPSAKAKA
jgi:hypothetical protein